MNPAEEMLVVFRKQALHSLPMKSRLPILEFAGPVQVTNAATLPMENSRAGTPADPSGATTAH